MDGGFRILGPDFTIEFSAEISLFFGIPGSRVLILGGGLSGGLSGKGLGLGLGF